jgi:hypothetical protein
MFKAVDRAPRRITLNMQQSSSTEPTSKSSQPASVFINTQYPITSLLLSRQEKLH